MRPCTIYRLGMLYCLGVLGISFACLIGCGSSAVAPGETSSTSSRVTKGAGTVIVEVTDQNGGKKSLEVTDVAAGETVEAIMRRLDGIEVTVTGKGTTAFVHQIGELATGGGEGWTYQVDGERAELGIGSTRIDPPATITWNYGGWQDEGS